MEINWINVCLWVIFMCWLNLYLLHKKLHDYTWQFWQLKQTTLLCQCIMLLPLACLYVANILGIKP